MERSNKEAHLLELGDELRRLVSAQTLERALMNAASEELFRRRLAGGVTPA